MNYDRWFPCILREFFILHDSLATLVNYKICWEYNVRMAYLAVLSTRRDPLRVWTNPSDLRTSKKPVHESAIGLESSGEVYSFSTMIHECGVALFGLWTNTISITNLEMSWEVIVCWIHWTNKMLTSSIVIVKLKSM